jgi:hypothetical protein
VLKLPLYYSIQTGSYSCFHTQYNFYRTVVLVGDCRLKETLPPAEAKQKVQCIIVYFYTLYNNPVLVQVVFFMLSSYIILKRTVILVCECRWKGSEVHVLTRPAEAKQKV